jgi:hypothetical protein
LYQIPNFSIAFGAILLIAIIVAGIAGITASDAPGSYQWPQVRDHGATVVLAGPSLLNTSGRQAVIWYPATSLIYQAFDPALPPVPILMYPDVNPLRWETVPAAPNDYHIIWLESTGRLRSALVSSDGQTLRGPIDLPSGIGRDFQVLSLSDGRAAVLGVHTRTRKVLFLTIDDSGRPEPVTDLSLGHPLRLAGAADRTDAVHLAWLTMPAPGQVTVNYQPMNRVDQTDVDDSAVTAFTLAPDESVSTFHLGLDQTHIYIIWGITTVDRPDTERLSVLTFPFEQPDQATVSELRVPTTFTPTAHLRLIDPPLGYVARLPNLSGQVADLRWPCPAPGQADILALAISLRTSEGWEPAVIYFQGGQPFGYQIVAAAPADVGPVVLNRDSTDNLRLAWLGLVGTTPHLYTAYTDDQGLIRQTEQDSNGAGLVLAGLLGLVWFVVPGVLMFLTPRRAWTLPLAATLYSSSKLIWPPGLYNRVPSLAHLIGLGSAQPGLVVGSTVLLIGLIATSVLAAQIHYRRPPGLCWLTYAITDAILTWMIFGPQFSIH